MTPADGQAQAPPAAAAEPQRLSTLLRTLESVISGAEAAQDVCRIVVSSAIEDVLLRVSQQHGLSYSALVAEHRDAVVGAHCSLHAGMVAREKCRGKTRDNKPCRHYAQINGYCKVHADQGVAEDAKRRRVEAYRATIAAPSAAGRAAARSPTVQLVHDLKAAGGGGGLPDLPVVAGKKYSIAVGSSSDLIV